MVEKEAPTTIFGHINELAKRMKVVLSTLLVSLILVLFLPASLDFLGNLDNYQPWVSVFLRSIRESVLSPDIKLLALEMTDPIELYVVASFVISLVITLPVLTYEIYRFIEPALYPAEKKAIYPFITIVFSLFVVGAVFGYYILFPFFIQSMFPFFIAVGAELTFALMDFYNVLFLTVVGTGAIFTFPAFFVLLVKFGILGTSIFRKNRKYVYVALLFLAMFISPGSSPQGNLFLFLPMVILLEASILVARHYEKGEKRRWLPKIFSKPRCKFCNAKLKSSKAFCTSCGKSQE